jgi:UDP-N-acetylmuramyl tripeptide synthase
VTNLFQDQVDRYGDVSNTLAAIRAGVAGSPETVLVLNADDPVTATLGLDVPNGVVWYGLEAPCGTAGQQPDAREIRSCMRCGAALEYSYVNYAHLGGYRCPGCGFERPAPDAAVTSVLDLGPDGSRVLLRAAGEEKELYVNLPALYNISNAAGCVAASIAMGLGAEAGRAAAENFKCGFGRMEKFDLGAGARMILIKNAAGANQVLEFLARQTGPFRVVFVTNNRSADGTDMGWLDDARFSLLAEMEPLRGVTCAGICAADVRAHILGAGFDETRLDTVTDYEALAAAVEGSDVPVFILPSYTGMMEFRPYLAKMTGSAEFWE